MTFRSMIIAALASTLITAGANDAYAGVALELEVASVNKIVFEVASRGSGSAQDLWCGAAAYALRALKSGWKTDIYVVRGRGRGVATNLGTAAQFTLDPGAAGVTPIPKGQSYDTMAVGYFMTVQRANSYCAVKPNIRF